MVIGLRGVQFREKSASNFKSVECVARYRCEIMSPITPELYDTKSYHRLMHQSIPPAPSPPAPPWATTGHSPALSVPGVGHLQILHYPGAGHLPTPGPFPSVWHAGGFLSEYNYTEGLTGKKADWLICQEQNYIPKLELSMWIKVFWLLNQVSVDII